MKNKTAELYAFIDKMDSELGDVWTSDRDCLANVLDTYASLQCAEMKEENEKLKEAVEFHKNESGFFKSDAQLQSNSAHKIWQIKLDLEAENKQLQEEVERLKKENTKTSALLDLASADARLSREEVERLRSENETLRAYRNTL